MHAGVDLLKLESTLQSEQLICLVKSTSLRPSHKEDIFTKKGVNINFNEHLNMIVHLLSVIGNLLFN